MTFPTATPREAPGGRDGQGSLAGSPGPAEGRNRDPCNLVLPTNHWLESWNDFDQHGDALTCSSGGGAALPITVQGEEVFLRCLAEMGRPWREATSSLSSDAAGRSRA